MKQPELKLSTTLEDFQKKTADHVTKALKSRPIYSIADQVGLGKTWIVAEVLARRLNKLNRVEKKTFLFYVAPSDALLRQNIKRIHRYVLARSQTMKPGRQVIWYPSRLSTLLLDSEVKLSKTRESTGGCVHIVGLTSDVSFKLSGTGTLSERAFLCAVFLGAARDSEFTQLVGNELVQPSRWFFLLGGRSRKRFEFWYEEVKAHVRNRRELIEKVRREIDFDAIGQEFRNRSTKADPKSAFVRIFRRHVTHASMKVMKVTDVVLDEWHRYSGLCLDPSWNPEKLKKSSTTAMILPELLNQIRTGTRQGSAAILISATPFVVRFEGQAGHEDLRSLAYIAFGKENGEALFQDIQKQQGHFLRSVHRASENELLGKSDWQMVADARLPLEKSLLQLTVRTERPISVKQEAKEELSHFTEYWRQTDLLVHLAEPKVKSPVSALWADSRRFVEAGDYKTVQRHWASLPKRKGRELLKTQHWKIQELQKTVDHMLATEERSKAKNSRSNEKYPPLWLRPRENSLQDGVAKTLIFSEFTITPHEISDIIQFGPRFSKGAFNSDAFSGSIYGRFPDYRQECRKNPDKTRAWVHFFPLVAVDTIEQCKLPNLQRRFDALFQGNSLANVPAVSKKRDFIWQLLAIDHYLLRSTPELRTQSMEELECRIRARAELFGCDFDEIKGATFYELKCFLRNHAQSGIRDLLRSDSPSVLFAQAFGKLQVLFTEKINLDTLESSVIHGSEAILRLFSTPEAQLICDKVYRLSKEKVEFARIYCREHDLSSTLDEYFDLLATEYLDADDPIQEIMEEFHKVVTLGRGQTNQSRYIRPYSDSRVETDGGSDKKIGTSDLRAAFNSPFAPYTLVTTSIGQEGIDFHRYCRRIIHWSVPHCPSALQQREGRLDRYRSLQVREAIRHSAKQGISIENSGFSPNFTVLSTNGERLNTLERRVLFLPFSQQEKRWERCLERNYLTGILVGTPDPVSVEMRFRSLKEKCENPETWQRVLNHIRENSVSLEPPI